MELTKNYKILTSKYNEIIMRLGDYMGKSYITIIVVFIYKINLDLIYINFIANHYSTFYLVVSPINIVSGWLLTILIAISINIYNRQRTSSAIILIALNIIYFIPITTYCGYGGGSSGTFFFTSIYCICFLCLQYYVPVVVHKTKKIVFSNWLFYGVIIGVSIVTFFFWVRYSNFKIMLDFFNVYELRAEAASYSIPQILQYTRAIANIIIAICIVLSLYLKKYLSTIWLLFLTLIAFSFAGDKSVILFPIILVGGYLFYRNSMINLMFPVAVIIQCVSVIEVLLGTKYIVTLLFYRTVMVPVELADYYYRFFSNHGADLFRNGIMGKLGFESAYSQIIPNVIGNNFVNQTINCNSGLLADVWAGIGIIGVIIMPIILICCFRALDFVTYGIDQRLTIGIVLFFTICFTNTSWSTVLITKGFIVVCMFFLLFPKNNNGELGRRL